VHGVAKDTLRFVAAVIVAAGALGWLAPPGAAEEPHAGVPPPAWPTSPYHGVIDGDGKRIPCLCRFREADYRVGDTVCMNTHLGVQLARCDLILNNTSWIPIGVPCTMSGLGRRTASLPR
jgi:hypothetical protein